MTVIETAIPQTQVTTRHQTTNGQKHSPPPVKRIDPGQKNYSTNPDGKIFQKTARQSDR